MNRRGFTIAELIIVITIMAVLLTLGVVNFRSQQSNARDAERKADVESVVSHLETFYNSGDDDDTNGTTLGTYPPVDPSATPTTGLTADADSITTYLRDIDLKSATAPTVTTDNGEGTSLVAANNSIQTPSGVTTAFGAITVDQYVYQPLKVDSSGVYSLCTLDTDTCVKFNLYYKLENAPAAGDCIQISGNICMITSRHQ
jgi:prepilin-type N-terminal cleavage/methylation domain-containing protein